MEDIREQLDPRKEALILATARAIFLARGFVHSAMADIAEGADVSTATLYKHFPSKEALFGAVVRETAQSATSYENVFDGNPDTRELLKRVTYQYLSVQFGEHLNDLLRIVIAEAAAAPALAREMYDFIVARRNESFKHVLDYLVKRGDLKPHDTSLSALFGTGMTKELFVWPALFDKNYKLPANMEEQIEFGLDVFLARYGA